jgi:hypothetical protein
MELHLPNYLGYAFQKISLNFRSFSHLSSMVNRNSNTLIAISLVTLIIFT